MRGKNERIRRERLEADTSERLAAIVAAAERAATQVIDDAEREARRQLADAQAQAEALAAERISALTSEADSLIAQAEEIRQRTELLLTALSRLKGELEGGPAAGAASGPVSRGSHLSAVAPVADSEEATEEEAPEPTPTRSREDGDASAGARLLATQMAVSGSSREEIAARLRNGFDIDDPEAILEAILGPEG